MGTRRSSVLAFLLGVILGAATSCRSGSAPFPEVAASPDAESIDGAASSATDAAGEQLASGTPGAPFWFKSSIKLDVNCHIFDDTWGPNAAPPSSSCTAWSFTRDSLTDRQQSILETATLQALPSGYSCTLDGYDYCEAIISDQDGSAATYRDTNCDYLRVPDAKAILSSDLFHSIFPLGTGQACL